MAPDPATAAPAGAKAPDPLVLESFLWGLLSASSLNIGSIIGVTCLPKRKARAILMAFGGGALLFALSVELFGHVLHVSDTTRKRAPVWIMEGSAVLGGLLFAMLNRFLNGMGADYRKASTSKGRLARMRAMLMRRLAVRLWNVPFFSSLSLDELKDLIQYAMYKERFNPGDIIMSETHESGIYFIISGMVRLQIADNHHKKTGAPSPLTSPGRDDVSGFGSESPKEDFDSTATPYTWDLGPNHIFGDMTVLTGSYVSTIVEALETTKVLVLPGHEVSRLMDLNASVRAQVSLATVERLRQLKEFNSLPTCALASLSSRCSHAKFQPGEVIFSGIVDDRSPILAVVLGSVELNYQKTGSRKNVHASCLICTEHFKGKDCLPFTAVASAASFVLIIPRDALEEAMCMSPKQGKYVWSSSRSMKIFEERHSQRQNANNSGLLPLKIPEDDGKVFTPSQRAFQKTVSPNQELGSELSIEPVDSDDEDEENVDRYDLPGQVKWSRPIVQNTEILELDEIEPGKPKERLSDVVSTAASTPALQPETEHFQPETVHPSPNRPQQLDLPPRSSVQTLGDSTAVELGRMPSHNLSNLGQNLGWDGREFDIRQTAKKDKAVSNKLARGKSMLDIAQVTDQELAEQDVFEHHDDSHMPLQTLQSSASPIATTIRSVRRMSKGACDFHLPARVSLSEQGSNNGDLEQGKLGNQLTPPAKSGNGQLMPAPRPSISRTRTPSKQRAVSPNEASREDPGADRESMKPAANEAQPPQPAGHAHNPAHAAFMVWLGILIDAVPESLVIGILVNKSTTNPDETVAAAALPFVISVFLSNLPEAMSSSGSMKAHGMRVSSILLMWFVTTFLTAIGALIGAVAFPPSTITDESTELVVSGVEGLAAGAMLTMIAQTMMPEAFEQGGDIVGLSCLAGFLCAMTVKLIPV